MAADSLVNSDEVGFLKAREQYLIAREREFQQEEGVTPSEQSVGRAPVDTE